MLLQAVDSIQLLQDNTSSVHLEDMGSMNEYTSFPESVSLEHNAFTPSRQLRAVLDSPLPDPLIEFDTINSKDYTLYGCSRTESPTSASSLPSPLAYPTPPASHETIAQASPFLDDSHHFSDGSNFFLEEKKTKSYLMDANNEFFSKSSKDNRNLTESERILQLKHELFNDSKSVLGETHFFRHNKSILDEHDLFKSDNGFSHNDSKTFIGDKSAKLQDFNQNLDFLDEAEAFNMVDDRSTSSPLSAAFFANMSTAEEVKEALEILPNEDDCSTLDLYFLTGLQSHMMSNSDDPLLSSIPRDFNQIQHQLQKDMAIDTDVFSPPENKKIKTETIDPIDSPSSNMSNKRLLSVQTEQILTKENIGSVFLSPNSISSTGSSPKMQYSILSQFANKSKHENEVLKKTEQFRSIMKKTTPLRYTPSPMLNPERLGNGLFASVLTDELIGVDMEDSTANYFEKPRVNIGSDYQATLPNPFCKYEIESYQDTLLWKPEVQEDDRQLDRFIDLAKSSAVTMGLHSIESALKVLLEAEGEIHVAVLKLLQNPENDQDNRWTQSELEQFLHGLENYGKDFTRISQNILTKSAGECVQLYYFWKKLCNEYKSSHLPSTRNCNTAIHIKSNGSSHNFLSSNLQNGSYVGQNNPTTANHELRPHVCEVPDCSAVSYYHN